jgi:ABC-2 type transport system ATP-binding protein
MIQLEDLTKEFDVASGPNATVVAANRLNLHIPAGEVFGLVGPNGAGKSTTLKMICGLSVPTSGRVLVNDIDVERRPEDAQRYIGCLADFFSLYDDLKVWEYLDYFAQAYKLDPAAIPARIDQVITQMGLESKRDAMIGGLSRGMKQHVGIGRAIIHDPPLLVLDEPTGGLDPKARTELKQLLREMHRAGKTIFITSHILSDLEELCTSIGILEKGKLLRVGRLEDVMREGAAARQIRIRLASPGFAVDSWLAAQAGVSAIVQTQTVAQFSYSGGDVELAEFVRAMVVAGAPVCGVQEVTETLEQLYSRISSGEVM